MENNAYVYPYSLNEAKNNGADEVEQYRQSRKLNCACKDTIEAAIRENFDGSHLNSEGSQAVIAEFGHDRVRFVLANTVQQLDYDGRFSHENKAWAKSIYIPPDEIGGRNFRRDFIVGSHPAVLDGFVNQTRKEYQALNLFERKHCNDSEALDFSGKVMVLDPTLLKDAYKSADYQAVLCDGGFGCAPDASGRKVYGKFLVDDERCQYQRTDFIGELKAEFYPDWLKEKLEETQSQSRPQEDGGIKMT